MSSASEHHAEEDYQFLQVRWRNFRGFHDTGWITLKPLTLLIGENNTGKSSLLAPLLLLKQTLRSRQRNVPLKTKGEYVNLGTYRDFIRDHELDRDLSLAFRFHMHDVREGVELKPLGAYPPGELEVTFGWDDSRKQIVLKQYLVRDMYGRVYLCRDRQLDGSYNLTGLKIEFSSAHEEEMVSAVLNKAPNHFLFDTQGMTEWYSKKLHQQTDDEDDSEAGVEVTAPPPNLNIYLAVVETVRAEVEGTLRSFPYIGPIRDPIQRVHEVGGEPPESVGAKGENSVEILYRAESSSFGENINKWLTEFKFGSRIESKALTDDIFSSEIVALDGKLRVNLADTGFGVSQVLPLIVQLFATSKKERLITEQPEIHLNPRQQAILADMFAAALQTGKTVLAESHSEHLLMRLRRLVAEGTIPPSSLALYYVERTGNECSARPVEVQASGHIEKDQWPTGFFDQSLKEAIALASAQSKRSKQ